MDALTVAAQFAAYTWFEESYGGKPDSQAQAMQFARENWVAFLGNAQEGLGRLLIRIGRLGRAGADRKRRHAVG